VESVRRHTKILAKPSIGQPSQVFCPLRQPETAASMPRSNQSDRGKSFQRLIMQLSTTEIHSEKVCTVADIIHRLETHRTHLEQLNVKKLYLFGSIARGEATDQSDADFLLEYDRPFGLFQLVAVGNYLEKILGRSVDLGTEIALKEGFRESVMRDLVDVF
jgi:hypothetical protein